MTNLTTWFITGLILFRWEKCCFYSCTMSCAILFFFRRRIHTCTSTWITSATWSNRTKMIYWLYLATIILKIFRIIWLLTVVLIFQAQASSTWIVVASIITFSWLRNLISLRICYWWRNILRVIVIFIKFFRLLVPCN